MEHEIVDSEGNHITVRDGEKRKWHGKILTVLHRREFQYKGLSLVELMVKWHDGHTKLIWTRLPEEMMVVGGTPNPIIHNDIDTVKVEEYDRGIWVLLTDKECDDNEIREDYCRMTILKALHQYYELGAPPKLGCGGTKKLVFGE